VGGGRIRIEPDRIKELCTEASFERGRRYFEEGRVKIISASSFMVTAKVAGTRNYRVDLTLDDENTISATCTCPYDWGGYCKHVVATLLAMNEGGGEIERMMLTSGAKQQSPESLLKVVEPEDLRSFLCREMERSPEMRARFMACFSKADEGRSLADYKGEAESLFDMARYHGFIPYGEEIDLNPLKDLAEIYVQKGDFMEAAKIYQAVFETVDERMDEIDDSDGNYGSEFDDCLEAFLDCINRTGLGAEEKRPYIKHLFVKFLNDSDYFGDEYGDALDKLCTSDADLEYWKELIVHHIPMVMPDGEDFHKRYRAQEMISMQIHVLSRLKTQNEELYALLERFYRFSVGICLAYAQQLRKDGDREKAVGVAEEGLTLFPDHVSKRLREFLCEIYRGSNPQKYRENLLSLFFLGWDWKCYEQLKNASTSDEWGGLLLRMLDHIVREGKRSDVTIEIYLKEKMNDEALQAVLAENNLYTLRRYHTPLATLYPEQYFRAYQELIFPFAGKETGRRHYREVVSYLQMMKEIEGFGEEFREIVARLRETHRRQPAFIDEMKDL
jgi:hypothetical protein